MKYSLAIAALLSIIEVKAINSKTSQNLIQTGQNEQKANANNYLGRFVNSKGEAINLAQEKGHARLVLTKIKKTVEPVDITDLQMQNCDKIAKKEQETKKNKEVAKDPLSVVEEGSYDEITHCPVNKNGDKVQAHIQQTNLEDNAYISDMYVGNPPQKIRGLFDTGSTNTWILNKNTSLAQGKEKEFSYDDEKSNSRKKTPQKAIIQFGSGALGGHFFTDDIRLGSCDDKSSGQIHIKNQKFGNVEKQKTIFTGSNFEAIVGMAYPELAEKGVKPVFDEMIDQKLLKNNMFSFYLTSKQAENQGLKSDLTLGYYDKEKFKGDLHWNPVQYKYMYGVKLDDIKVNGKSTKVCEDRPAGKDCLITFDSGTSLMSVPTFATKKLVEQGIPTANHVVKCKDSKQFGDMSLVIGGKDYPLNNDEWMFPQQKASLAQGGTTINFSMGPLGPQIMAQIGEGHELYLDDKTPPPVDTHAQLEVDSKRRKKKSTKDDDDDDEDKSSKSKSSEEGSNACASTIMKMDISHDMFLVGDVFMRKYYTVFDRDNDQVGLAPAVTSDKLKALSQTSDLF